VAKISRFCLFRNAGKGFVARFLWFFDQNRPLFCHNFPTKIERFLSQPFFVAEFFTNSPGQYVKLQATISGLTGLVDGMYDQWEEQAFPHRCSM